MRRSDHPALRPRRQPTLPRVPGRIAARSLGRRLGRLLGGVVLALLPGQVAAHPHVFVDGGIDFVLGDGARLEALRVTWIFDDFETLYTLSAAGVTADAAGTFAPADREKLAAELTDWPEDFAGSAHLSVEGAGVPLAPPSDADARLVDGRLAISFTRRLTAPLPLAGRGAEVAFYEATYFYAFSVTEPPQVAGAAGCTARVTRFDPDTQLSALQATLFDLGREETPAIADVGALFADRITLRCE